MYIFFKLQKSSFEQNPVSTQYTNIPKSIDFAIRNKIPVRQAIGVALKKSTCKLLILEML